MDRLDRLQDRFKPENWRDMECPKCGSTESVHVAEQANFAACDRCVRAANEQAREEQRARFAAAEKANRRANFADTLARIGAPLRYQKVPEASPLPAKLRAWRGEPWCLVFTGEPGCGKTFTATRLLGEIACETEVQCAWADASEIIEGLYGEFRGDSHGSMEVLVKAGALLIDDLGAVRDDSSKEAEFIRSKLSYLLRQRYNWMRPTIITTDKGMEALEGRIASRVFNGGEEIKITGKDRRSA